MKTFFFSTKLLVSALVFLMFSACVSDNDDKLDGRLIAPEGLAPSNTTYYLIRHAEKDRSDPLNKNPELNDKGFERAQFWGDYFKVKTLENFYTTDYMRTFQTMIPIVYPYKDKVKFYKPTDSMFSKEFWKDTYGKNNIVVGHSNTTPQFVNQIIGVEKYKDIPDSINYRVYKVVIDSYGKVAQDTFENIYIN